MLPCAEAVTDTETFTDALMLVTMPTAAAIWPEMQSA
jgi:hypothetical protein